MFCDANYGGSVLEMASPILGILLRGGLGDGRRRFCLKKIRPSVFKLVIIQPLMVEIGTLRAGFSFLEYIPGSGGRELEVLYLRGVGVLAV